jgi:hypothetical protein
MNAFSKSFVAFLAVLSTFCGVAYAATGTVITTVKPQDLGTGAIMGTGWYQMVNDYLPPVKGTAGQVLSKTASGMVWRDPGTCTTTPVTPPPSVIDCGTAKNKTYSSNPPVAELCTDGLTRTVTSSGALYIWSCSTSTACSAFKTTGPQCEA